jgi:hypothetical protein
MIPVQSRIQQALDKLLGLQLSQTRRAAELRIFHFGRITTRDDQSWGEWALHIQCSWRVEGNVGLVTGKGDLWEPLEPLSATRIKEWNYHTDGNMQDAKLSELLGSAIPVKAGYAKNSGRALHVETVSAARCGGFTIGLSGGYELVAFTDRSVSECWRLFKPDDNDYPPLVVIGGRVRQTADH